MSTFPHIPIRVEHESAGSSEATVGAGLAAILCEIATLLERLVSTGEPGAIDLRSLPLSPADRALLLQSLGTGEVDVRLQANGESRMRETAVHGVWWTEHRDSDGVLLATLIEVARVPEILLLDDDDLARGASRLRASVAAQSAAQGEAPHGTT